jgi:hypothetical protein
LGITNFTSAIDTNGVVTPGSIAGQGTPTVILPSGAIATNGLGSAMGSAPGPEVIQIPVPIYIPAQQPVDQYVPAPTPQQVIPGPPPTIQRRGFPIENSRLFRPLPRPFGPIPPPPR